MDTPIQVDLGRIAQDLQIRRVQVESVIALLDEGNTVPFITRYRKERTGNLNELAIREIQTRVSRLRELAERKETVLKSIEAQGKLTDELRDAIRLADNPKRLEDLYLPYKPKKRTKASDARDKGLEPLALRIWNRDESLTDLAAAAAEYLNPEKELDTPERVLEGVGYILAESINELANVREAVRRVVWKLGKLSTSKVESVAEGAGLEYRDYFHYTDPIGHVPPHRVLAINRGDKENILKARVDVPRQELERALFSQLPLEGHPNAEFFHRAAIDALDRLLVPSLEREVRRELTEVAERHAIDVFARNLRSLLLTPPITGQVLLAIDPGFRTGCKVAVLDPIGNILERGTIYPHQPQNRRHESKLALKEWIAKHQVGVVAIGNGTACRETEELIGDIIAEGTYFHENPGATVMPGAAPTVESKRPKPEQAPPQPPPQEAAAAEADPPESAQIPEPALESAGASATAEPASALAEASAANGESGSIHPPDAEGADPPENPAPAAALPPIAGGSPDGDESEELPPALESPQSEPAAAGASDALPTTPETTGAISAAAPGPTAEHAENREEPAETETETHSESTTPPAEATAASESIATPAEATAAVLGPSAAPEGTPALPDRAPPAPKLVSLTSPPLAPPGKPKPAQPRPHKVRQPPPPPKPHAADPLLAKLAYVIVNEAGASVYSASAVGGEEFPDLDATERGTISIGRRLLDPLAELVKIEPQHIGVGLYQQDMNPKHLKDALETVVESCVNFVGVNLNTASVPLLRFVSGLNQLTARRVVDYRKEKGPFTSREELKNVEGIGPLTFTQAAGFLKIPGGAQPLDRTWIHPESYAVAEKVLEKLGFSPEVILQKDQLPALRAKLNEADLPALARELGVGEPTVDDIFESLARPERDPRDELPAPIFKKGVLKLQDLSTGMELMGTVLNVVDFGAFVDIGLKDSGLVHISQIANRYIKTPHDVVSVGDVVTVWVMGVDNERKRVSLTMVRPGSERPRGGPAGGRRGQGQGQGQGQIQAQGQGQGEGRPSGERRGGGQARPPRRDAGAPQGSAGAGEGAQAQPQRSDRHGEGGRGPEARPSGPGARVPGPPSRGSGFGGPGRGGPGRGGPGRGGPRSGPGGAQGRFERPQQPLPPRPPAKPAPPPPPLSKDALTGSVPLRTFGQLKQLWQARTEDSPAEPGGFEPEAAGLQASPPSAEPPDMPPAESPAPAQVEPSAEPQPMSDPAASS